MVAAQHPADDSRPRVAVVGGGPAGLMAAEAASAAGVAVDLYEGKGSVGRKFLVAGRGGLNLTHAERAAKFVARYADRATLVGPWLDRFGPAEIRAWARGLGVETFIGSSLRVFPKDFKAAPLLRQWVHRLREQGVRFHVRHRLIGWSESGALRFESQAGEVAVAADSYVLALGGASWPQLGSDGAWVPWLAARGVAIAPLVASNCGFDCAWSAYFATRHAGAPLKPIAARVAPHEPPLQGECVVTATGLEGQLVYALSRRLQDALAAEGRATLHVDLLPGLDRGRVEGLLAQRRAGRSRPEHWRRSIHLTGAKAALLHELVPAESLDDPVALAASIKSLPIPILAARPIEEAISTGGGVSFASVDSRLMLVDVPGTFCAGEMLDWDAPTGGYLLTACLASGRWAGRHAAEHALGRGTT